MISLRPLLAALALALAAAAPAGAARPPLGEGAWSWFGDPRAVSAGGKTFVGWVDHEGDIKVASFDDLSGERVTAVLQARLNQDDHANPSIHVRPDGRLMVFYSRHVGPAMHYRVSTDPGDVRSWGPPRTVPVNVPGPRGYTYPNPIRLEDEDRTYLFWRGGNYNPTFSIQQDGSDGWSAAENLIVMPNERPYTKYAQSGGDTIHVAYTNAHPREFGDVNIYYARVRGGEIQRAGGQAIGSLAGPPIAPEAGDLVFDQPEQAWVHDVAADPAGNPVIVFASFPTTADHRYHYARWTGSTWEEHEITAAGGSFREDGGSPHYSGGLTLDHEDPSRVYLSRQVGAGWRVEAWTTPDGGATWTSQAISATEAERNVRPVSPRGMPDPFTQDLRVLWMRGAYPNYEQYGTSILALTGDANLPPVADAEPSLRGGPSPLEVRFDGSLSHDPDGSIEEWEWDFGDGTGAEGSEVTHRYEAGGRYFPALTVTDGGGASSTVVEEIAVDLPRPPTAHTGATEGSTAHGAIDPENRPVEWYFEYGPTAEYGARTALSSMTASDSLHQVSAELPGLVAGRLYHYRLVASSSVGTTEGEDRVMVAGEEPGSDAYRDSVLATPGLAGYWRLGEASGSGAGAERGPAGTFAGRFVLGQVGVLGPLGDTAAGFDGTGGETTLPGPALGSSGSVEGWFRWRAGTAVMRDDTGPSRGWLPAFNSGGTLRYRVGGQGYDTEIPIEDVRDGTWHHVVATKSGAAARLYVDGAEVHAGGGADNDVSALPWHVMRNGTNPAYADGEADEVALYTRALTAAEVKAHYDTAGQVAGRPLPAETPDGTTDPPAAGTGLGGGVLGGTATTTPAGRASLRGGVLVVRGAPGTANRLTARRRGRAWVIADAVAPLRAGAGCRQAGPRGVRCPAARVKRIELHGGAGADRLSVIGRARALLAGGPGNDRLRARGARALLSGGPGADRLVAPGRGRALLSGGPGRDLLAGGPLARFRGGPGADRLVRRPGR
jgi:PKD repeat protein